MKEIMIMEFVVQLLVKLALDIFKIIVLHVLMMKALLIQIVNALNVVQNLMTVKLVQNLNV